MTPIDVGVIEDSKIKKVTSMNLVSVESVSDTACAVETTVLPESIEVIKKEKELLYKLKRNSYFGIKRLFDIFCSILGILMLIPVAIVTKICYIASGDKKSIFYKQKRIGKDGRFIYIYKFRSMVHNADEVLKELLKKPEYKKNGILNQKFEHDPRITKNRKYFKKNIT